MYSKAIRAAWLGAALIVAWNPAPVWAVTAVQHYVFNVSGSYTVLNDPPIYGTLDIAGPPSNDATGADIFLPSLGLEFNRILSQGINSGQFDVNIVDTTNTDELLLVIDNPSDLFAGSNGATIDSTSLLVTYPGGVTENASAFTGTLDLAVPAPAALPVFATALTMLGVFRRRRAAPTTAAA